MNPAPTGAPDAYIVRRFRAADAPGVAALVRRVYADTYVHPELYHPEELVLLNQTDENVSVVAVAGGGEVVGHYALIRHDRAPIAESGEAMVLPEHRAHHLLDRMRLALEEEAHRLDLHGVYGLTVTVHVFSQKAVERAGAVPTGLLLGLGPQTTRIGPEPLKQRFSGVLHFKYLRPPQPAVINPPPAYADFLRRIYAELRQDVEFRPGRPPEGKGTIETRYSPAVQLGFIRVVQVGEDTAAAIDRARRELCAQGAEVVFLDLPLADPGTAILDGPAEAAGFLCTGLGPLFADGTDALRMQYLNVNLDLSRLQIASDFARDVLLAFVADQRRRVTGH